MTGFDSFLNNEFFSPFKPFYSNALNPVSFALYASFCVLLVLTYCDDIEITRVLHNACPVIFVSLMMKFVMFLASVFSREYPFKIHTFFPHAILKENIFLFIFFPCLILYFFNQSFKARISKKTYFAGLIFIFIDFLVSSETLAMLLSYLEFKFIFGSYLVYLFAILFFNLALFTGFIMMVSIKRDGKFDYTVFSDLLQDLRSFFHASEDRQEVIE